MSKEKTFKEVCKELGDKYGIDEKAARAMATYKTERDRAIERFRESHCWLQKSSIEKAIGNTNAIMAQVLSDNGIRPRHLLVEYQKTDCESCPEYDAYGQACGDDWRCSDEDCPKKNITETVNFYSFVIDDDYLQGITSSFKEETFDVLKITDCDTGKVLYKHKKS